MKKEKTQVRAIARLVALGFDIPTACKRFYIEEPEVVESWKRTAKGDFFKKVVREFQERIESDMIDDAVNDPEYHKAKVMRREAVDVVHKEIHNYEKDSEGATSSSRLAACKMAFGISQPKEEDESRKVYLNLSESLLKKCIETTGPADMPSTITG